MFDLCGEVLLWLDRFDLDVALSVRLRHVLLVALGVLLAEFLFYHELEGVGDLVFVGGDASNQTGACDLDRVDCAELPSLRFEAVLNECEHIELQIQPHTLQQHRGRHTCVQRRFLNIVFRIGEMSRA